MDAGWGTDDSNRYVRYQADNAIDEFEALTSAGIAAPVARQQVAIDSPTTYDGRTIAEHAVDQYTSLLDQNVGGDEAQEHAADVTSYAVTDFEDDAHLHRSTAAISEEDIVADLDDPLNSGGIEDLGRGLGYS
ncbi:hypothetical protein [Amycolatopsis sp. lyj-108]|uniref:hypothetical protein n=1 Tax=Amycolatopsis sp. lyj-108 TaxID=2789286 RepID=UPI003978DF62